MSRLLRPAIDGWRRFWFEPQETSTLAVFRIAFGLLVMAWALSLIPNLFVFFGPDGIEPGRPERQAGEWGLLTGSADRVGLVAVLAMTLIGAVALTVGCFTRIAAVLVFAGVVSFEQRNGLISNSGDGVIRNLAFYCMLAPCGAALSLDRLRTSRDAFWQFPARAPWALRLIQIQISVGYLSAAWQKVQGETWRNGTAVGYALRIEDIQRFPVPDLVTRSAVLTELLTFGTLGLELALGVLVWNRAARPWVLALGMTMHLAIEYAIVVGFFGFAMVTAYLAFLTPETASRRILAVRDRLDRITRRRRTAAGRRRPPSSARRPATAAR